MAQDRESTTYDAQDITVLEGLEAVPASARGMLHRGPPGCGGLHPTSVYEVVDKLRRRGARRGTRTSVEVTIHPDNSVTVVGRRPRHSRGRHGEGGSAGGSKIVLNRAPTPGGGKVSADGGGYKVLRRPARCVGVSVVERAQ